MSAQTLVPISPEKLDKLKKALPHLPDGEKRRITALLKQYSDELARVAGRKSFLEFIKHVYPGYIVGPHHLRLIKIFEDIAAGKKKRVIVNIAPRHGKSELISYLAPAWFLGNNPQKKVIMTSHTGDLAVNFGRRVRNLVGSALYKDVFPQIELQADSKSASRWGTNFNGEYFAIGVGGALAGRGADLFIIDDPHSEQEAMQGRAEVFEPAWEWFQSGPIQRLMPGGAIIIVMCMTGDTPVLMSDATQKPLRDIQPGDMVASYEDGRITSARVNNHRSNGIDSIYKVQTQSGIIVRANERHPFLVDTDGVRQWIRLRNLKPGMCLVATQTAYALRDHRQSRGCAAPAKHQSRTTRNILTHLTTPWAITGSGGGFCATPRGVQSQSRLKDFALRTTTRPAGSLGIGGSRTPQRIVETYVSRAVTGLHRWISTAFSKSKTVFVQCVDNLRPSRTPAPIGATSSALTTVTAQGLFGDSYATTATSQWGTPKLQTPPTQSQSTSDFTLDPIVSITPDGEEEVFDIEVDRTENFIANGVVSHNTRWSKLDLTGRVIDHMVRNEGTDEWEVVEFPAILDNGNLLWPDFWSMEEMLAKRASMDLRYWQAQYMQNPTSEEGALIKREWWQIWEDEKPPKCEFIIMSLDAAQETNNRADFNALTTWGVFFNEKTNSNNIILLNCVRERLEFPDLKEMVLREYKDWEPDSFIVEKKSNGAALYQELRRMGVPVADYTPGKGQDKLARVNSVSDMFKSGIVWAPPHRWAREVIEECNDFPSGTNDDMVDATTLALMRFRQGGFLRLPSDEPEETKYFKSSRSRAYY